MADDEVEKADEAEKTDEVEKADEAEKTDLTLNPGTGFANFQGTVPDVQIEPIDEADKEDKSADSILRQYLGAE